MSATGLGRAMAQALALGRGLMPQTLIHSCVVSTRQQARDEGGNPAYDAYEQPILTDYAPWPTRVPCYAFREPGPGEQADPGGEYVASAWQVRFAAGTAIDADAQLSDLKDERGVVLAAGPIGLSDVQTLPVYVLAICQAVSLAGPQSVEAP